MVVFDYNKARLKPIALIDGQSFSMNHRILTVFILFTLLYITGCQSTGVPLAPTVEPVLATTRTTEAMPSPPDASLPVWTPTDEAAPAATATHPPEATSTTILTPTSDIRPLPATWRRWPVVPTLSARAAEIYQRGLALGNDPHSFSRIGDCQSEPGVFMGIYGDPNLYHLDQQHQYLQATIDQFNGSFGWTNITARRGFGISSVLSPLMSDPKYCTGSESPLECEFRVHKPSIVFISMGTNWCANCTRKFDGYLRKIVDFSIDRGVLPVLTTKADNVEGDNSLNADIAQVAYDYDLPMWNFWAAVQNLPGHGLKSDGVYLTVAGWDTRSFTGLLTLDTLWSNLKPLNPTP
jgi:hypothetical protein